MTWYWGASYGALQASALGSRAFNISNESSGNEYKIAANKICRWHKDNDEDRALVQTDHDLSDPGSFRQNVVLCSEM